MSPQYRVQNPVDNQVIETFPSASDASIEQTLADSATAYREWSALPLATRAAAVTRVGELFEDRKEELAEIAATEMGKPLHEGIEEAEFASAIMHYFADNGAAFSAEQEIPTGGDARAFIRRLPIGPLLGVMPWNFPYYQIARFAAPNLVLGNTIVLKDAEICPRSAVAVQQIMDDAGIPHGVYSNVFATHEQIGTIIADPRVQGVSLTGSERAGSIIGAQAGKNLKKAVLELGGSDPFVLLDAADVKAAARLAWNTRMYNTGQACNSNKRMIVMDDIYDEFLTELVDLANKARPVDPHSPESAADDTYCPLSSRDAAENLDAQLRRAVAAGATVHAGGELAAEGAYFSPAVLSDVPVGSDVYYEELFGPVATVYRVASDAEALELANNTQFGLGGTVYSQDPERAAALSRRLEVGMACVNTPSAESSELPFGGVKRSGFGRELGPLGMDEFVNKQLYYVEK
ncbi:NAD-dependent succinate-semialdehyde dehydrogenase [Corynebacterium flavescens]|uniref:Succinate-semialdehyde dehydrogenase n=1 Tax=Corynebacterium flavescens TaxID=28028 RepID=A0A1L7CKK7_CORFL|nr:MULTISPECIES: NAD-dependent succinate-semialdehyde dehydrogenase [Corynebacterium]APT86318.1 succinate-semialdehyde dehydrogenase [Corynebacterium flavescens]KAA8724097.1 NAD-dependent succinate-semialdehyde dehydrogenase [Corynebacterium flavescens]MDN6199185.1 NAD-dependent succinate-semialdehyde dehydrogenase [Corynebacterium flavescens]MDN6227111.1 NAD-dependent succinate-semialdehyde dehydrogenase [Corynebacterium flavescens]MDN6236247.1 NAD-dependent succinate-semialdehyde dehydrogena